MIFYKRKHIIFLYSAVNILAASQLSSQENDFVAWAGVNFEKKVSDKLKAGFETEIRLNENISQMDQIHSDIGLSYEISNNIKIGGYYRYTREYITDGNYFGNCHRYYVDLSFKYPVNRFTIAYRARFQSEYAEMYSSENGFVPEYYNRDKFVIRYNIRKNPVSPFASCELFYQLNNPDGNEIDKLRYAAGIEYKINNDSNIDLYLMMQQQVNKNDPVRLFIIGTTYSLYIK